MRIHTLVAGQSYDSGLQMNREKKIVKFILTRKCDYHRYGRNLIYICIPTVHIIFLRDRTLLELRITKIIKPYKQQK